MARDLPQFIYWRAGRPRFIPGEGVRKLGFKGEDLKAGGAWMSFEQARDFGERINKEIDQARRSIEGRRVAVQSSARGFTNEDLLEDWLEALRREKDDSEKLSPDTIESYEKASRALIFKPETRAEAKERRQKERAAFLLGLEPRPRDKEIFASASVSSIGKIELNNFYKYLKAARGDYMARAAIAAWSAAYTWGGLSPKWRLGANPRHQLSIAKPEGRIVIYSDAELRALDAAAAHIKRWSIGDSLILGVMTAQRQRDRIMLADEGLLDGRRMFRQSKTKKLVAVKETPQLAARLAEAARRNKAIHNRVSDTIVVDEATGQAYVQDTYRHWFGIVRLLAAHGVLQGETAAEVAARAEREKQEGVKLYNTPWILAACPSLAGKKESDLRDTAVTWLARAGCTMGEICAISGHSARSVQTIIDHYLGSARELGDAAIDKLTAWMQREGIAV